MNDHFDVIIVGAGPAGASCAKTLELNNVKTLLIDKKKFPRTKTCCGLLTKRAVDFISHKYGNIPESLICDRRNIEFMWSTSGKYFNKLKGFEPFISVKRDEFDYWLVKESQTQFLDNCEVVDVIIDGGKILVRCNSNNNTFLLSCTFLVCACGSNSSIRKKFDSNYSSKEVSACIQKIYEGNFNIQKDKYYAVLNKKLVNPGYSYFCFKDNAVHIGVGWAYKYNNYFENWFDLLKKIYSFDLRLIRDERCCIENPFGKNNFYLGNDRIIFVGEAAGLLENWGVGITSALISGEYAALSISTKNVQMAYYELLKNEIEQIRLSFEWKR
jgi:flavin-dependent dehydrogenase